MTVAELAYQVEIEIYKGPFDLLIKAIDEGQIDIYAVSISGIVNSFFAYWRETQTSLVFASDFVYMAAYLLEMKSKAILPANDEIIIEEEISNIEDDLVSHLREYEVFKSLATTLRQRKELFDRIYARHEGEESEREIELVDVTLRDLVLAFKRIYDEAAEREKIVPIPPEEISLEERIIEIRKLIAGRGDGVPLEDLFRRNSRLEVIVTFLAVLELAKQRYIKIMQGRRFGSILVFAVNVLERGNGINAGEN